MNFNEHYLSPSQVFDRIQEIEKKREFDFLSEEEAEELTLLRERLREQSIDLSIEF